MIETALSLEYSKKTRPMIPSVQKPHQWFHGSNLPKMMIFHEKPAFNSTTKSRVLG